MWGALAALLGLVTTLVTWWVANSPRVRYRQLLTRIRELEQAVGHAVATRDMDALAGLQHELRELRQTRKLLDRL